MSTHYCCVSFTWKALWQGEYPGPSGTENPVLNAACWQASEELRERLAKTRFVWRHAHTWPSDDISLYFRTTLTDMELKERLDRLLEGTGEGVCVHQMYPTLPSRKIFKGEFKTLTSYFAGTKQEVGPRAAKPA